MEVLMTTERPENEEPETPDAPSEGTPPTDGGNDEGAGEEKAET